MGDAPQKGQVLRRVSWPCPTNDIVPLTDHVMFTVEWGAQRSAKRAGILDSFPDQQADMTWFDMSPEHNTI